MSFLDKDGLRYFWQGAKKKFYNKSEIDTQREELQKGIEDASKTGGVSTGSVIGWNGGEVPEGYEENSTMLEAIANAFFPIGYTFIDTTGTIDYSNHLGLVWEKTLQGVTPVGQKTSDTDFATVGATGGAKTHKLTTSELPSHNHSFQADLARNSHVDKGEMYNGGAQHFIMVGQKFDNLNNSASSNTASFIYAKDLENNGKVTISNTGSGATHNNLQPYQVVTFWTRVG